MTPDPTRPRWADAHADTGPGLVIHDDVHLSRFAMSLFHAEQLRAGHRFVRSAGWPTSAESLLDLDGLAYHGKLPEGGEALLELDGAVARVNLSDGRAFVNIAAGDEARTAELLASLRKALPPMKLDEARPQVPVTFWSLGKMGPVARTRLLDVPPFDTIAANYVEVTRAGLEPMMRGFRPGVGGQLALWHGPPGTGKTFALRALAWEWRRWADLHYVTDPETFFGSEAAYMLEVLFHDERAPEPVAPDSEDTEADAPKPDDRAEHGRWKLLVLEDTGELMAADARQRSGQGLSRLLNVVDGLIGQGLRVLALVTTNEPIRNLHEAVARPGRCAVNLEFAGLPTDDAAAWLVEHGDFKEDDARAAVGSGTTTVADLFAIREERETTQDREREPAGFAR